jgi:hypothetical protein
MNTGITIEQLIATVARVEAEVERKQSGHEKLVRFPLAPLPKNANLLVHPGVA